MIPQAQRGCWVALAALAVMIGSGCASAPKNTQVTQEDPTVARLTSPSGLYIAIQSPSHEPKVGAICAMGLEIGVSNYPACPSTAQMLKAADPSTKQVAYVALENMQPVITTNQLCARSLFVGPSSCQGVHSEELSLFSRASTAVVTFGLATMFQTALDPEKVETLVNKKYSPEQRRRMIADDLAYRGQAAARTEQRRLQQLASNRQREQESRERERRRQEVIARGRQKFEARVNGPKHVGTSICTPDNRIGYVEQVAGDRVRVSVERITIPSSISNRETYALFSGEVTEIRSVPQDTRWESAARWAPCGFERTSR